MTCYCKGVNIFKKIALERVREQKVSVDNAANAHKAKAERAHDIAYEASVPEESTLDVYEQGLHAGGGMVLEWMIEMLEELGGILNSEEMLDNVRKAAESCNEVDSEEV